MTLRQFRIANPAHIKIARTESMHLLAAHKTCRQVTEITNSKFPRFFPCLQLVAQRTFRLRTRRHPAIATEVFLPVLDAAMDADGPAECLLPALSTLTLICSQHMLSV